MDVEGGAKSGRLSPGTGAVLGAVEVITTAGCAVGAGGQPAPAVQAQTWSSYRSTVRIAGHPGSVPAVQAPFAGFARTAATDQTDYAIAYDTVSGRRSGEVWSDEECASL